MLFTSDRCCALRIHCCQAEPPPTACWLVPDDCGPPFAFVALREAPCCPAGAALRASSFSWIYCRPSWVGLAQPGVFLLTRHMLLLPSCHPLPCIPHSPASFTHTALLVGRWRGVALQALMGYLSFWNLFRSLTLVFIHLSLKAGD